MRPSHLHAVIDPVRPRELHRQGPDQLAQKRSVDLFVLIRVGDELPGQSRVPQHPEGVPEQHRSRGPDLPWFQDDKVVDAFGESLENLVDEIALGPVGLEQDHAFVFGGDQDGRRKLPELVGDFLGVHYSPAQSALARMRSIKTQRNSRSVTARSSTRPSTRSGPRAAADSLWLSWPDTSVDPSLD